VGESVPGNVQTSQTQDEASPASQLPAGQNQMQSETPKSGSTVQRRQFLQATGASALAMGVWSEVPAQESTSPNEKLKVLCVGTANRASADINGVQGENIIGLCKKGK
jgi:hypothetical protein